MHNSKKHKGIYTNYPSGVTETGELNLFLMCFLLITILHKARDPNTLKEILMSGMDAVFQVYFAFH
jgi:hypothetical protein